MSGVGNISPMTDVTITASGGNGMYNALGSPIMTNVTITASGYGMYSFMSSPTIKNSDISGTSYSIYLEDQDAKVGATVLDGPIYGSFTCVGVYDGSFTALGSNCL